MIGKPSVHTAAASRGPSEDVPESEPCMLPQAHMPLAIRFTLHVRHRCQHRGTLGTGVEDDEPDDGGDLDGEDEGSDAFTDS